MQGLVTSVGGRMDLVTVYVTENCWVDWTGRVIGQQREGALSSHYNGRSEATCGKLWE